MPSDAYACSCSLHIAWVRRVSEHGATQRNTQPMNLPVSRNDLTNPRSCAGVMMRPGALAMALRQRSNGIISAAA